MLMLQNRKVSGCPIECSMPTGIASYKMKECFEIVTLSLPLNASRLH